MRPPAGTLYIVATPIGNLEDITQRALRILGEVDCVLAEDTRHSRPLLNHYGIQSRLESYHEYSSPKRAAGLVARLDGGQSMALLTDAGTPGVSDPGARLVLAASKAGIEIVPIPGVSALTTAMMVAGLPTEPLHFWGFLSPRPARRKRVYQKVLELDGTHCFFESPHKLLKHIEEWKEYFADFECFIGREMTKQFETLKRGKFIDLYDEIVSESPRGEYTILFAREGLTKNETAI